MDFDSYQKEIVKFDQFEKAKNINEPGMLEKILGLSGEAGEVADKFKKIIRDKGGVLSSQDKDEIVKELGDVLWYLASIARYLDVPLSEVAQRNVAKLSSRQERGKLGGEGDNR